jgi:hypothetical protein
VSGSTTVNTFNVDVISEKTSAAGVTIDGVLLKDNGVVTGAGTVSAPVYSTTGDTNTGIFFPAADTIAFAEGGAEAMRINSSGNVGIGTTTPQRRLTVGGGSASEIVSIYGSSGASSALHFTDTNTATDFQGFVTYAHDVDAMRFGTAETERMRIDSSGNVGIGTTSAYDSNSRLTLSKAGICSLVARNSSDSVDSVLVSGVSTATVGTITNHAFRFVTNDAERARITSGGDLLVGKTSTSYTVAGTRILVSGTGEFTADAQQLLNLNRLTNDGGLVEFYQANVLEGAISVSGNTITYGAFCGGHWTQLQEGRGYNPDIPRGTVMSSIGEMAVWKSVEWTETVEHPAIEAVEAVEAVLDEDGNVIEPAVEAVEGKDAWTETLNKREAYLGNLDIGATFEEDGFTKTVVDDGNERLPKVKISDVVGDKAVYGVFQTWDEVEDMLISSLGAFVVRIASGVTVEVGDLLESNGDGCAKVQDDDIIRSKTIGKVTSTVATDTYDDGSYTVPCVLYCG